MKSLDDADPRSVGGYPLFARLGAGGMGQVYLARTPAGRALALKTVRSEFGLDPGFGERFAREIRHADRVRSPWTVTVVDYSRPGDRPPWLATEYVAAPSLSDWVAAHGALPAAAVGALAAELSEALRTVHQAGLTHRDVKPSNVLLGRDRPLLIDFGIARAADDSRHTRTGGVIGSPGYMAPEQATAGVSGEPGDLFALGAVLVYAATGHGPFNRPGEEPSTPALLYRVVHEEPDLDGIPDSLAPLIRALLAKEPQDRPDPRRTADLLREAGRVAGAWSGELPGLEDELLVREAEMRDILEAPATPPPAAEPAPSPAAAQGGNDSASAAPELGPSPYAPATGQPYAGPYTPTQPPGSGQHGPYAAPAQTPPPGGSGQHGPYAVPGQRPTGPYAPTQYAGSAPQLPPTRTASPGWNPPGAPRGPWWRGPRGVAAAVGAVVLAGVIVAVTYPRGGSGDDDAGGDSPTTTSSATTTESGTSQGSPSLPAAMVGTWIGDGPGDPYASKGTFATKGVKVTLTLHAGSVGKPIGQDVANITEISSGSEVGCTEQLLLTEVSGRSIHATVSTSRPTDPDSVLSCVPGNQYTVTLLDDQHLKLGPVAGHVAAGAPDSLTKQ
ncbi:protein kinase domain-containing protein [Streptomyces sp. CA-111067]|uniref:serine/threonine-protein kinase n=1 Tax=Streptomyces sp. CA-111067 TaxID=3240046 RepID=UPI003D954266